jgi:hypothetical protein
VSLAVRRQLGKRRPPIEEAIDGGVDRLQVEQVLEA